MPSKYKAMWKEYINCTIYDLKLTQFNILISNDIKSLVLLSAILCLDIIASAQEPKSEKPSVWDWDCYSSNLNEAKISWVKDNFVERCKFKSLIIPSSYIESIEIGNKFDKNSIFYHQYYFETEICNTKECPECNEINVYNLMISQKSLCVPTTETTEMHDCEATFLDRDYGLVTDHQEDPIITTLQRENYSITNYTVKINFKKEFIIEVKGLRTVKIGDKVYYEASTQHMLHPGKTQRTIFRSGDKIYIGTLGDGVFKIGGFNNCLGKRLFSNIDQNLKTAFKCDPSPATLAGTISKDVQYISPTKQYPFTETQMDNYERDETAELNSIQQGHGENKRYGFVDKQGKVVIPLIYVRVHDFHEGVAAVKKGKGFFDSKWGFINLKGEIAIPFIYDKEPSDFHSGRAFIQQNEVALQKGQKIVQYTYIDKNGNVIPSLTQKAIQNCFYSAVDPTRQWEWMNFNGGFVASAGSDNCIDYLRLLDINGVKYDLTKAEGEFYYLNRKFNGVTTSQNDTYINIDNFRWESVPIKQNTIVFEWVWQNPKNLVNGSYNKRLGMMTPTGRLLLPPIFTKLTHFDPISRLAYAIYEKGDGPKVEGYISKDGVFQIIKQ